MTRQDTHEEELTQLYVAHQRGFERLYEELVTAHRQAARLRAELEIAGVVPRRRAAPRAPAGHQRTRPL